MAFTTLFSILAVLLVFPERGAAQDDAASIHAYWAGRLRSAASLRVIASSSLLGGKRLSILAARPQKYRIDMSDRVVVCDGSKVWNYSVARNSVVVSRFRPNSSAMSVETLLLDVLGAYKPVSLKNRNASAEGSGYVLRLEPSGNEKYGVRSMEITLDRVSKRFRSIDVTLAQGTQSWTIESLRLDVPVAKSAFTFKNPKNCEVIAMDDGK
ncbi:MAG: LolA family protein [Candidatus Kapaibacterium sp.]